MQQLVFPCGYNVSVERKLVLFPSSRYTEVVSFSFFIFHKTTMLTQEELAHVAQLARIEMDEEELQRMAEQLDAILRYAAKLAEVDTTGVVPTTHTQEEVNALRDDEVQPSLSQEQALYGAPVRNAEAFIVPRVIT